MAFMMPVMKNDYDIYAHRSRRSSSSASCPRSRRSTRCSESLSNPPSLSCSPGSDVDERLAAVMRVHSASNAEDRSRSGSQLATTPEPPSPKSASQSSLHIKFHSRLVDRLKRTFKIKDDSDQHQTEQASTSRKSLVPAS